MTIAKYTIGVWVTLRYASKYLKQSFKWLLLISDKYILYTYCMIRIPWFCFSNGRAQKSAFSLSKSKLELYLLLKIQVYKAIWTRHIGSIIPINWFSCTSEYVRQIENYRFLHTSTTFSTPKLVHSQSLGDLTDKMHDFCIWKFWPDQL